METSPDQICRFQIFLIKNPIKFHRIDRIKLKQIKKFTFSTKRPIFGKFQSMTKKTQKPAPSLAIGVMGCIGGLLIQLVAGSLYQWGIVNLYITSYYRLTQDHSLTVQSTSIAFPIMFLCIGITMRFGVYLSELTHPLIVLLVGQILQALTMFVASYMPTVWLFILFYGIIFGLVAGACFMVPLQQCNKYLVGKKMIVNGIVLMGSGLGALVFGWFSYTYLNPNGLSSINGYYIGTPEIEEIPLHVPSLLRWLSLFYLIIGLFGVTLIAPLLIHNRRAENQHNEQRKLKEMQKLQRKKSKKTQGHHHIEEISIQDSIENETKQTAHGEPYHQNAVDIKQNQRAELQQNSKIQLTQKQCKNSNSDDHFQLHRQNIIEDQNHRQKQNQLQIEINELGTLKTLPKIQDSQNPHQNNIKTQIHQIQTKKLILPPINKKQSEQTVQKQAQTNPPHQKHLTRHQRKHKKQAHTLLQAICSKVFWIQLFILLLSLTGPLMLNGNYKTYVKNSIHDDRFLTIVGVVGAVGNGCSRFLWNLFFSKTGYKTVMISVYTLAILVFSTIKFSTVSNAIYLIEIFIINCCLGGFLVTTPTSLLSIYGSTTGSNIFGLYWENFGIANLIGYVFISQLAKVIGFDGVIYVCLGMTVVALILVTFTKFQGPWANDTKHLEFCADMESVKPQFEPIDTLAQHQDNKKNLPKTTCLQKKTIETIKIENAVEKKVKNHNQIKNQQKIAKQTGEKSNKNVSNKKNEEKAIEAVQQIVQIQPQIQHQTLKIKVNQSLRIQQIQQSV